MYNRYIPQSDGSYRKNRIPEPHPNPPPRSSPSPAPSKQEEHIPGPPAISRGGSVGGFLRKLLPKEFDTGDLLIVLLLLLMAERCEEEQNTALLTLALYFFM